MARKRLFRFRADRIAVTTRQGGDKLGKCAGLGLHVDPAAMLLEDDAMCYRQAKPRAFPGRLSSEEGTRRPERRRVARRRAQDAWPLPSFVCSSQKSFGKAAWSRQVTQKNGMPR